MPQTGIKHSIYGLNIRFRLGWHLMRYLLLALMVTGFAGSFFFFVISFITNNLFFATVFAIMCILLYREVRREDAILRDEL
jgi:uncharacterized membrane protein YhdT